MPRAVRICFRFCSSWNGVCALCVLAGWRAGPQLAPAPAGVPFGEGGARGGGGPAFTPHSAQRASASPHPGKRAPRRTHPKPNPSPSPSRSQAQPDPSQTRPNPTRRGESRAGQGGRPRAVALHLHQGAGACRRRPRRGAAAAAGGDEAGRCVSVFGFALLGTGIVCSACLQEALAAEGGPAIGACTSGGSFWGGGGERGRRPCVYAALSAAGQRQPAPRQAGPSTDPPQT